MKARYPAICALSGARIQPGDEIVKTPRGWALKTEPGPRRVSDHFIIGGQDFYRNKNGRCEDAPCCGCCTI